MTGTDCASLDMSNEEALYHLLKKEEEYYAAIMKISRQENFALQAPVLIFPDIQRLLSNKHALMASVHEIEQALLPLKKYWKSKGDANDFYSLKIKEKLIQLNLLLKEILSVESDNQERFEQYITACSKAHLIPEIDS